MRALWTEAIAITTLIVVISPDLVLVGPLKVSVQHTWHKLKSNPFILKPNQDRPYLNVEPPRLLDVSYSLR